MTKPIYNRLRLLVELQRVYDDLVGRHSREQRAIGGRIPAGGGDWMDLFFKMEGIRGVMTALIAGKPFDASVAFGKSTATIAIKLWNKHREYQVHRWEQCMDDYVTKTARKCRLLSSLQESKAEEGSEGKID